MDISSIKIETKVVKQKNKPKTSRIHLVREKLPLSDFDVRMKHVEKYMSEKMLLKLIEQI